MSGPNHIVAVQNLTTWNANGHTKIVMSDEGTASRPPKSCITAIKEKCDEGGEDHVAFRVKRDGKWIDWSYAAYHRDIYCVARAFIKLGLEERHSVCIQGFNSPEWFLSCLGAVHAGGICTGLYPTNGPDVNKFILEDCKANILVVEDCKKLKAIEPFRNQLPHLKCIIVYDDKVPDGYQGVYSWKEVMRMGEESPNNGPVFDRQINMAINQCAILIYTSGTTGNPKGVMLSHDNIIWTAEVLSDVIEMEYGKEHLISYLPLNHIAGQMLDIWLAILNLSTVHFADKGALKGTLLQTMQEARPTTFFGVPRVWEKIMEGMKNKGKSTTGLRKILSDACKQAGLDHHLANYDSFMYYVGQYLVYGKVTQALGLDRCRKLYSGAAPISHDTIKYFLSLDIVIHEAFGMSEVTGPHCVMPVLPKAVIGSVGPVLPGSFVRITDEDIDGNGEVYMRGRNVMMGYLNREDKTTEDIDEDGWLHSGDIGSMDKDGFVFITGRIKELIITAGGENVAPVPIEEKVKEMLPCLSNAVLTGDKRKYLACLLTFKVKTEKEVCKEKGIQEDEENSDTPTNNLSTEAIEWCISVGSNATTVNEILETRDANVFGAIQIGIDKANKHAASRASTIQKWDILPLDLSVPTGELGPTLKLKRFAFNKKYENTINKLYA